jgi:hypothetical protein
MGGWVGVAQARPGVLPGRLAVISAAPRTITPSLCGYVDNFLGGLIDTITFLRAVRRIGLGRDARGRRGKVPAAAVSACRLTDLSIRVHVP